MRNNREAQREKHREGPRRSWDRVAFAKRIEALNTEAWNAKCGGSGDPLAPIGWPPRNARLGTQTRLSLVRVLRRNGNPGSHVRTTLDALFRLDSRWLESLEKALSVGVLEDPAGDNLHNKLSDLHLQVNGLRESSAADVEGLVASLRSVQIFIHLDRMRDHHPQDAVWFLKGPLLELHRPLAHLLLHFCAVTSVRGRKRPHEVWRGVFDPDRLCDAAFVPYRFHWQERSGAADTEAALHAEIASAVVNMDRAHRLADFCERLASEVSSQERLVAVCRTLVRWDLALRTDAEGATITRRPRI